MNLFSNIFDQFTGQAQPQVPSFGVPQAPRTTSYVAPNVSTTQTSTGIGSTTTQKPINTSLPMGIPEPVIPVDTSSQMKAKFGFNDKDIEFLRQAKQKGYDSKSAFEYITKKKEQEKVGEDLGIMGNIGEGIIGALRAGEQIPRIAGAGMGYLTQNVTGPLIAGGLDLVGADTMADKWRAASKKTGEGFKSIGEDITRAGEGDITEKQRTARRFGGEMALTAPIGGGYLAGSKGALGLAGRSGVVGAGFGAAQPIIGKGGEATLGDIATGGIIGGGVGAVAGPLIGKVIAPAIGGIANKTGKYGTALYKGGIEGAKKSIVRDISAIKTPGVETITRNIPKAVVRRDLGFTPTERAKIEKITGQDEGTYILSKGLAGKGKEELAEVFMRQSDDMYNGITKELAKVDSRVQSPVAKEALIDIMEQLESSPKIARAYAKDIEGVKAMLARDDFSLSELNNIRRAYDKVNTGMFTVQGKARSGLENAIDVKVRQDLSSQLQKEAKNYGLDVKAMNTELRAGLEMKDALLRRLSQEERNNFIGLQDLGVSAILSGGEPISAVATIVAKKYAEKVAPGLAQKAFNLNKTPNVTRTVSRGNTITPRNKPSGLGLSGNPSNPVVSDGVTPKVATKKVTPTKNESKGITPKSSDTVPEGYFKNAFGEIQKNPSNKKGGFIKIPEIGKKNIVKSPDSGLIEEARKYKSAEDFIKAQNKKDYRSAHQLNNADSVTADKININNLKEAIRTRNGYLNNYVLKDLKKLEKLQNNPEGKVTIYRASPKNELNEGDWVTTDKSYAQYIKKQNGGQVNSFDVYVKDLRFPNDLENLPSLQMATTFNYGPNIDKLTQIYKQAHKPKSIIKK